MGPADDPVRRAPLVLGAADYGTVTEKVCRIVEAPRPPKAWYVAFGVASAFTGVLGAMMNLWQRANLPPATPAQPPPSL